jgi:histidine ammonia-lyase
MDKDILEISGHDLTVAGLVSCVANSRGRVALTEDSLAAMGRAHRLISEMSTAEVIYGVNTGFGPMGSCVLARDELVQLQYNLIRSHAAGVGDPVESRFVLAAMIVRLNTLAQGASGVSRELADTLQAFINHRITPVVPEHGAVGTSGDLVQLAHVALALIGEGDVMVDGRTSPAAEVLARLQIAPHVLRPKEGLSLINGTAMMTGIAALLCAEAARLIDLAIRSGALCLEIVRGFDDGISEALHRLRPHRGQRYVAAAMRQYLRSSRLLRNRRTTLACETIGATAQHLRECVQEVYSIRCIPQILGPVHDAVEAATATVETELNAVTDNPVVSPSDGRILHGGNFHGDYIAAAMDHMKIAIVKLTMLSERRINFFLNANVNRRLPPFLNRRALGLNLGLQGAQFVATSTTAQSQTLAYPQYLHSIPTNGDNQDVVSLGTDAALLTKRVVDNAFVVLALEAMTLAQATECLGLEGELCETSRALYDAVRAVVPSVTDDRPLSHEIEALVRRLRAPLVACAMITA